MLLRHFGPLHPAETVPKGAGPGELWGDGPHISADAAFLPRNARPLNVLNKPLHGSELE